MTGTGHHARFHSGLWSQGPATPPTVRPARERRARSRPGRQGVGRAHYANEGYGGQSEAGGAVTRVPSPVVFIARI